MKRRGKAKPAPIAVGYRPDIRDGASSKEAIRTRIALIAAERSLPKSETAKVMGRLATRAVGGARRFSMSKHDEETFAMIGGVAVFVALCIAALLWMG